MGKFLEFMKSKKVKNALKKAWNFAKPLVREVGGMALKSLV